jgi:NAD-dependent dihydropyrimidine dehydrogenase PreA subunit
MITDQKISINFAACTGCVKCYQGCPTDVFRWNADIARPIVAFPDDCSSCYVCEDLCPVDCIHIAEERSQRRQRSIYDRLNIPI